MEDRLNRAARTCRRIIAYRQLIAVCLATYSASSVAAQDDYWNRPQRISAPVPMVSENGTENRPQQLPDSSLFIREPLDDKAPEGERQERDPFVSESQPKRSFSIATHKHDGMPTRLVTTTRLATKRVAVPVSRAELAPVELDGYEWSQLTALSVQAESDPANVLPGFSTASLRQSAVTLLNESAASLAHRASHSAASSATDALRLVAQSIDSTRSDGSASSGIDAALLAIREAEDFVGRYGHVDAPSIARMVRSHETNVLKEIETANLSGIVAADIYLDSARQILSTVASSDPLAAHAIGLLAKSYRQRASEAPLALATSVHLMRAAVAAVPNDRSLAIELAAVLEQAKLDDESQKVRAIAMQMLVPKDASDDSNSMIAVVGGSNVGGNTGQSITKQAMQVEQLSPEAFASVSRPEAGPMGAPPVGSTKATTTEASSAATKVGNPLSRAFKSMTQMWR